MDLEKFNNQLYLHRSICDFYIMVEDLLIVFKYLFYEQNRTY